MIEMTPSHWFVTIVFFLMGLFLCSLFSAAERGSYYAKGEKKYNKNGKVIYFVIYVILILFVMLQKPGWGMEPYLDIFKGISSYEGGESLFSIGGLYSEEMEPFFMLWVSTMRNITDNQGVFLFFTFSYIWFSVLYFSSTFYKKHSFAITFMAVWPALIDFIFGMRYAMAVATCLLAMVMFKKHRYILGVILSIVAGFTHFLALCFILFIACYFILTSIFKEKIHSSKVLLLMSAGSITFMTLGYSLFSTFRFAYRMTDTIETNSFLSYAPMVFFALVIHFYSRTQNMDTGDKLCSLSSYFNMVMLPVTAMWGVYRIPYLFLLPITVELNNVMSNNRHCRYSNIAIVTIVLIFSFIKIITMGIQNHSLDYTFIF